MVERGGLIEFSSTAHTADVPEQSNWHRENPFYPFTPGMLVFPSVTITNKGVIKTKYAGDTMCLLLMPELSIKKGNFEIQVNRLNAMKDMNEFRNCDFF